MSGAAPVVVVTGASRGIGRVVAQALAREGAWGWAIARDERALAEVVTAIRDEGGRADLMVYDLSNTGEASRVVEEIVGRAGLIDGLVNNAGTTRRGTLTTITPDDYEAVMGVNVKGLLFFTQAVVASMAAGGAIVNLASLNAFDVLKGAGLYAASKAAVVQLTRAMAIDFADRAVRVNAVAPGFIQTDFNAALWARQELSAWVTENTPLGRLGQPDDVVGVIRFLLGADSRFITGAVHVVDGGFLPARMWPL